MKSRGDERYHIANVLGISMDKYEEANPLSGLFTIAFRFNRTDLPDTLEFFNFECLLIVCISNDSLRAQELLRF